jgi:tetratricopeptide (TPR) repeat protein
MRSFLFLFFMSFFILSGQITGLREIKVGDKLPSKESFGVFKAAGNKLILYLKSGDLKSIAFFKTLADTLSSPLEKKKDLTLYVVDANPAVAGSDNRISSIFDSLKINKQLVPDEERRLYGDLGVIVIPTLILVTGDNTVHSLIAGSRPNLTMFFKTYLNALAKGEAPENVYEKGDRLIKEKKIMKMQKQAYLLLVNGNYELAGSMYRKVLEASPGNEEAELGIGYSLIFRDKTADASAYFAALKEKGENKRVLLGYYLCESVKGEEDSLAELAHLSLLESRFFFVIFKAAEILDKAGKCEESKATYRRGYEVLLRHYRRNK